MVLAGKSLDKIAELRENNKLPKPGKKKRQKASKVKNVKLPEEVRIHNDIISLKQTLFWQINFFGGGDECHIMFSIILIILFYHYCLSPSPY